MAAFVAGVIFVIAKSQIGVWLLLGASAAYVWVSDERGEAFMSLFFLMAIGAAALGLIGVVFDIPQLLPGPDGDAGGIGGW